MKYPLIKKLHLPIATLNCVDATNDFVFAKDLENLLQKATVVYGVRGVPHHDNKWIFSEDQAMQDTHKAMLIAIEPLEQNKVTITRADLQTTLANKYSSEFINVLIKDLGL